MTLNDLANVPGLLFELSDSGLLWGFPRVNQTSRNFNGDLVNWCLCIQSVNVTCLVP